MALTTLRISGPAYVIPTSEIDMESAIGLHVKDVDMEAICRTVVKDQSLTRYLMLSCSSKYEIVSFTGYRQAEPYIFKWSPSLVFFEAREWRPRFGRSTHRTYQPEDGLKHRSSSNEVCELRGAPAADSPTNSQLLTLQSKEQIQPTTMALPTPPPPPEYLPSNTPPATTVVGCGSCCYFSSVITSKEKGGLGVASLYALNRALMLKWVWRFFSNKESFWARVIKAIYGEDVNVLKEQGINLFEFMKQKMGDGANTCFWEDNSAEGGILKNKFPRVYALEKNKQVLVSVKMKDPGLDHSLRRKVRGGAEQSQLNALSELLDKVNLVPQADRHIWSLDSLEVYTVASMQKLLDDHRSSLVSSITRWVKYVPIKVNVFAWKVKMNALPARFNISRRGIDIESILCPLCDSGAESSNHLFFNCTVARHIFSKIVRWWDVVYKEVNSYTEWLSWLLSLRLASKLKMMLEGSDVKPRSVGTLG
ncbi:RNA-directed DNA polymerase, eukaryota, reverse transcriptase zinc-binding domain protein [Tanacetum coccineum]